MKALVASHGWQIAPIGIAELFRRLGTAWTVARERRVLATLDNRQLSDIGINPDAAAIEAARPVWDLPANR